MRLVALAAALAVAFLAAACAPTVNLSDPAGPKFEGRFAHTAAPDAGVPAPLRVVTFNVKLGREIGRAIEVLESDSLRGADVVALQEMDAAGVARWDHIFVRGLAAADPASVGVVARVHGASDHHPVWAVLRPAAAATN